MRDIDEMLQVAKEQAIAEYKTEILELAGSILLSGGNSFDDGWNAGIETVIELICEDVK